MHELNGNKYISGPSSRKKKRVFGLPTRFNTNQPVKPQKVIRELKFWILPSKHVSKKVVCGNLL